MLKGVKLVLDRGHLRSQTGLHRGLAWFHLVAYMFNKYFFFQIRRFGLLQEVIHQF